jgi:hypothetical protein
VEHKNLLGDTSKNQQVQSDEQNRNILPLFRNKRFPPPLAVYNANRRMLTVLAFLTFINNRP